MNILAFHAKNLATIIVLFCVFSPYIDAVKQIVGALI